MLDAMKQALEALDIALQFYGAVGNQHTDWGKWDAASTSLRQAIEQAEKQEPVAWELRKGKTDRVLIQITNNPCMAHDWKASLEEAVPLYIAPSRHEWVGLTDEDVIKEYLKVGDNKEWAIGGLIDAIPFARAIEAKIKENNT